MSEDQFQRRGHARDGGGFEAIAGFVQTQCVKIQVGGNAPNANANYDWRSNRLIFRPIAEKPVSYYATAEGRAAIVHECTHAIIDYTQKGKSVRSADNEFAAWLAQKVYAINAGDNPIAEGYYHAPLFAIARQISQNAGKGTFQVDPGDVLYIGNRFRAAYETINKNFGLPPPAGHRNHGRHRLPSASAPR